MNGVDLYRYLHEKKQELERALNTYKERGLADAEYEYKKANAKYIAKARMEKVAVTLIRDLAQGDKDIAELRLRRDS